MERNLAFMGVEARALAHFKFYCHIPARNVRMTGDGKWPRNGKAGQRIIPDPQVPNPRFGI
jgi:hypothetical protein